MNRLADDVYTVWVVHRRHELPNWATQVLTELARQATVSLRQISIANTPPVRHNNSWNQLINLLDSQLFPGADSASTRADLAALPDDIFTKRVHIDTLDQFTLPLDERDRLLNLSSLPDQAVADALGASVMSLTCGTPYTPVGLHECLAGAPYIDVKVNRHDARESVVKIIASATECTDAASIGRTRNAALWAGAELLLYAIDAWVSGRETTLSDMPSQTIRHSPPSAWLALVRAPTFYFRGVQRKLSRRPLLRQWILLSAARDDSGDTDRLSLDLQHWDRILPPRDVFWADPFVVERDGKACVFIEEATFTPRRGHLSVLELDQDGAPSAAQVVLKKPYHLSYPNVFEHDDNWYMMPESGEDKSLQVYRCASWPTEWVWQENVLEGKAVFDGTLLEHNGRWWLFATVQRLDAASPNIFLHLWHADGPLGPWHPHPANPIVSDVRRARPAGNFFTHDGVLYRPSQDCSTHYGHGLNICRVDQLDLQGYRETLVSTHEPWAADIDGVHTLNYAKTRVVADAIHWRPQ
ncbi:MAG: hypothetical protein AAF499_02465 [Pseudomonadota bacterium]